MTSKSVWRAGRRAAAVGTGLAAAGLAYSTGVEVRSFRLRRVEVPILSSGSWPVRVLHISDVHLVPSQHRKRDWIRALADRKSTRLNSSHVATSYAVFCLKKK